MSGAYDLSRLFNFLQPWTQRPPRAQMRFFPAPRTRAWSEFTIMVLDSLVAYRTFERKLFEGLHHSLARILSMCSAHVIFYSFTFRSFRELHTWNTFLCEPIESHGKRVWASKGVWASTLNDYFLIR